MCCQFPTTDSLLVSSQETQDILVYFQTTSLMMLLFAINKQCGYDHEVQ